MFLVMILSAAALVDVRASCQRGMDSESTPEAGDLTDQFSFRYNIVAHLLEALFYLPTAKLCFGMAVPLT